MCGRYSLFLEETEIRDILNAVHRQGQESKTGEIYPTNPAPVLTLRQGRLTPQVQVWGFPGFGPRKGVIINARAETAGEKPMFRRSLETGRCVVPSTGFYEWSQDKKKIKYRFRLPGSRILYMAGLYREFQGEMRYVILTTAANESVADVHDRMPVVLLPGQVEEWVGDKGHLPLLTRTPPLLERTVV